MHTCKTLILLVGLSLGIATATPAPRRFHGHKSSMTATVAPTHVAPSTCQTYYPSVLRQLQEAQPDVMLPNTANTSQSFHVAQSVSSADQAKFDRIHQLVVFDNIPSGSWDCQLMVSWPHSDKGNEGGMVVLTSSQRGTAATSGVSLDVYSASYNATAYKAMLTDDHDGPFATWAGTMRAINIKGNKGVGGVDAKLKFFSTVAMNPGEYGMTINSGACASSGGGDGHGQMFVFEVPNFELRDASVGFSASKEKGAGVYLLANC